MSSNLITNTENTDEHQEYIVYHGSLTIGIKSFRPGSHFGDLKQALICIGAHAFIDGDSPITPVLYKCKLKLKNDEIYEMEDWGSPNYQAALINYLKQIDADDRTKRSKYLKSFQSSKGQSEVLALEYLYSEISQRGHRAFSYQNTVESAGQSFMVLYPQDIEILDETVPCRKELFKAFSENVDRLAPTDLESTMQKARNYRDRII